MKFKPLMLTVGAGIFLNAPAIAQEGQPALPTQPSAQTELATPAKQISPPVCLMDENFRAFDFWLGNWSVTASDSNKFQGTNSIVSIEGGCALLENWTSATGGTGMSTNHYNPITKKWRQLWLSAAGYSIDIEGGIINGSMALKGNIAYYKTGKTFPFRGTWIPVMDGTVRQHFEQFNPEKEVWETWFDGIYTRTDALSK